uniref:Uncharacterized protein n=1 Tax=Lactuca sativa TaxID=4236 RepID=A0A9R1WCU3_LACSA|nr:hypothetical protein LSAT_V11C200096940 [Lactuca sativa]
MESSSEAHKIQRIYDYVESCIQQVGLEYVVQVVNDNYFSIGGLPRFKKVLDQAKKLTIFIYFHQKTLAMMRNYTKKREIYSTRSHEICFCFSNITKFI